MINLDANDWAAAQQKESSANFYLEKVLKELEALKKSCLRFDLPEQQEDMNIALNGHKYLRALCDIKDMLYSIKKWGLDSTWEDKSANDLFNNIDERFHETVEGLNL